MRLWYLRRAVSWGSVIGCCVVAVLLAVAAYRWPAGGPVLLPFVLAACAAAAAYLLDEGAAPVVAVTPRAWRWRPTTRYAVVLVPTGLWWGVVWWLPEATRGDVSGWLLAGTAACLLGMAAAAAAARSGVGRPGPTLAVAAGLSVAAPLTVGPLVGLSSPFELGDPAAWVTWFWVGVGGLALVVLGSRYLPARVTHIGHRTGHVVREHLRGHRNGLVTDSERLRG